MKERLAALSALLQFANGKLSMFVSTTTLCTVLSMKLHISFWIVLACVAGLSIAVAWGLVISGLYDAEQRYIGKKLTITNKP